ncbi:Ketoisovalerate reductase BEA2 [Lachnellula cervina]|uniref:2-dehydropantoate 2-reductase n=1 Tax=Lachnellula cervina TaxID=1316786 RepID=A0A7D8YXW0_9HELO|nr:Ketoisovalerate reductase BEA2 [Lachnellula cervina]
MSSPPRIHILGIGNIGRLFAHALANTPNPPPITLLMHRPSLLSDWHLAGRTISITTHGLTNSDGIYDVEEPTFHKDGIIENLIIATKTLHTAKALEAVKHRLNAESTVLFTQNGMGTTEEVTRLIFPEEAGRPSYLAAITSHGVYSEGPFRSVFAGQAHVSVGHVSGSSTKSRYLLDQIVAAKLLNAREFESRELRLLQLEKLVINATVNPLTVVYNCRNGELFKRSDITSVMRDLLAEASQVISSLPELQTEDGGNDVVERFSKDNLEAKVMDVAEKTAANTSSMLQDFRAGRETEVGYINGYIVKRGKELGINVGNNERIVEMVQKGKMAVDG